MKSKRIIKLKELAKELREYQAYINSTTDNNKENKEKNSNSNNINTFIDKKH